MDALHILPLAIVPVKTKALARARLVKNSRLLGMVELFSGEDTGSGQVEPDKLPQLFTFTDENRGDISIIEALSKLSSYDVYTLRVELRSRGIPIAEHAELKLSEKKAEELTPHMRAFTKPLVLAVYGDAARAEFDSLKTMMDLFSSPDADNARQNLHNMAKKLSIELKDIPSFLENYGDVYLSLAFYQHCLDEIMPILEGVRTTIRDIREDSYLGSDQSLAESCTLVETRLQDTFGEIAMVLDTFRSKTEDLWQNASEQRFKTVRDLILDYQAKIGGALCAVSVKMKAWATKFPTTDTLSLNRRADFLTAELRPGIETIKSLRTPDL